MLVSHEYVLAREVDILNGHFTKLVLSPLREVSMRILLGVAL